MLPHEGDWKMGAMAIDTAGQSDLRWSVRDWTVDSTGVAPHGDDQLADRGDPADDLADADHGSGWPDHLRRRPPPTTDGLATVEIRLRNSTTRENLAADGTWGAGINAGWFRSLRAGHRRHDVQLDLHHAVRPDPGQLLVHRPGDRRQRPDHVQHQPGPGHHAGPGAR